MFKFLPMVLFCVVAASRAAFAQTAIVGEVRDPSGAAPGVAVEAASPSVIETGTAVSDGSGRYRIENLRPAI